MHCLFVKNIDLVDTALWNEDRGIYGHSWRADIELSGPLDSRGFIYDFSLVKAAVKAKLKETIDHSLILPRRSKHLAITESGDRIKVEGRDFYYDAPRAAIHLIDAEALSLQVIEDDLNRYIAAALPTSIAQIKATLRSEDGDQKQFFHYTHGITGHEGRCQRLFHGHRSLIEVFVNQEARPDLTHFLINDLLKGSLHIADPSQVESTTCDQVLFHYTASDGVFKGRLPRAKVMFVAKGTSIELITDFLADQLVPFIPLDSTLEVYGYEGIDKGAYAVRASK